ncbi:unnamed protein product [Citrullus colocynthis]|uniref:Uncharacterized protein n=1 Tax=Citrullus colocynthis TaxID=252529 RepID=A0ABP0Z2A5_9ROSI
MNCDAVAPPFTFCTFVCCVRLHWSSAKEIFSNSFGIVLGRSSCVSNDIVRSSNEWFCGRREMKKTLERIFEILNVFIKTFEFELAWTSSHLGHCWSLIEIEISIFQVMM